MVDLSVFRKVGKIRAFGPNEVIFAEHDDGDGMYIPLKGKFGVYINSFTDFPTRVALLGEGRFFGEMAVIDGSPRSATVISEEQGLAVCVDKSNFVSMLEGNPEIAVALIKTLSERVLSTSALAGNPANLPENLKEPELKDCTFDNMVLLAGKIRELNFILSGGKTQTVEIKRDPGIVNLLPKGHKRFTQKDKNDNRDLLVWRYYICPYCTDGFAGKIPMFMALREKERTPDQRIIYGNFNMLLYTNIVCPNCNYCDTYAEFGKPYTNKEVEIKGNQFKNYENFTGYGDDARHTLDEAVLSCYLNLLCLKQTVPDAGFREAKAWHRLYWLYSDYNEKELSHNAAKEALNQYEKRFETDGKNLKKTELEAVGAIIAELKRVQSTLG